MEGTGDRKLIFSLRSVYNNQDGTQSLPQASALPKIFSDLSGLKDAPNFEADRAFGQPIKIAKVVELAPGKSTLSLPAGLPERIYDGKTKPAFVQADILLEDITRKQDESKCQALADVIRNRGYGVTKDDCGHIIARRFGGKMIDYNLFPQNKEINRGHGDVTWTWRHGIEAFIELWIKGNIRRDPMLRFRVLLNYSGNGADKRPDRLVDLHYHMEFYRKDSHDENTKERDERLKGMKELVKEAFPGAIANSLKDTDKLDKEKTKAAVQAFKAHLRQLKEMTQIPVLRETAHLCIQVIEESFEQPLQNSGDVEPKSRGFFGSVYALLGSKEL